MSRSNATEDTARWHIFISYARADVARIDEIAQALNASGYRVWLDRDDISGGANYAEAIANAIASAAVFLIGCSATAFDSRNVRQEIALAWKGDRSILPLRLEDIETPRELEYWLEAAQWVDILDRESDTWLPELLRSLKSLGLLPIAVPSPAPPPTQSPNRRVVLPSPVSNLIGRDVEIARTRDLLKQHRLVTLTGPGGIGKTSLAIAVARAAEAEFANGAIFVDLSTLSDASQVIPTIAQAFGASDQSDRALVEVVSTAIGEQRLLLVLDNVEQVVDAAPEIAALLRNCPGLTVLATSRVILQIRGEWTEELQPLSTPGEKNEQPLEELIENPAVALFLDRAQAANRGFVLTGENSQSVIAICRMLDGLPLAIELAATRTRLLNPDQLLERLLGSVLDLGGVSRDIPDRQRTLRDAIAWSYDLLTPSEQVLLNRLSVFVGGSTVEAAIAVVSAPEPLDIDIETGLESLIDNSLIRLEQFGDQDNRITMLLPIRAFATRQLEASGEGEALRQRHAAWFTELSARSQRDMESGQRATFWLTTFDAELDNVRAAIAHLFASDAPVEVMRLSCGFTYQWMFRQMNAEGLSYIKRALGGKRAFPGEILGNALLAGASMASYCGEFDLAFTWVDEQIALYHSSGNQYELGKAYSMKGHVCERSGDLGKSLDAFGEALTLLRLQEAPFYLTWAMAEFADKLHAAGDLIAARPAIDEALAACQAHDLEAVSITASLVSAFLARTEGKIRQSIAHYRDVVRRENAIGGAGFLMPAVAGIAGLALDDGQPATSARWHGALDSNLNKFGYRRYFFQWHGDRVLGQTRAALDEAAFSHAWEAGYRLSVDDAITEALAFAADLEARSS